MDHSKKDATLEACAGALQNLTASRGLVSTPLHTCGKTCQHLTAVRRRNVLQPQGRIAGLSTVDDVAQVLVNVLAEAEDLSQVCVVFQELLQVSVSEESVRRKGTDSIAGFV